MSRENKKQLTSRKFKSPVFPIANFHCTAAWAISIFWYKQSNPLFWLSYTLYANNFYLCTIGCIHSRIVQTVLEIIEKTEQRNLTALNPSLYDFVYIHDPLLS